MILKYVPRRYNLLPKLMMNIWPREFPENVQFVGVLIPLARIRHRGSLKNINILINIYLQYWHGNIWRYILLPELMLTA